MKLRNKKTGEIKEWQRVGAIVYGEMNEVYDSAEYNSLAELNEEWEDYKPAEPLIKDPKIRKAVRAWADANDVTKVYVYGIGDGIEYIELYAKDNGVTDGRIRISLPTQDGVWIGEEYAIAELCGSEEIEILEPTYTTIEEKEKLKEEE